MAALSCQGEHLGPGWVLSLGAQAAPAISDVLELLVVSAIDCGLGRQFVSGVAGGAQLALVAGESQRVPDRSLQVACPGSKPREAQHVHRRPVAAGDRLLEGY